MNNFYCAAPWRGLHINPQGYVKTCCAGNPSMMGNLESESIESVLQGPMMQDIRDSIRQGKPHEFCRNCVTTESMGGDSERSWHNRTNPDFDATQAGLQYEYPVIMDVRWNTTCNLSCNYCDQLSSSKWAAIKKMPFVSEVRHYYNQVCDFVEKHNANIKEVALVGGEPLLLPENSRLLDVLPEDCRVVVITNLTTRLDNNEIFQKLKKRKNVSWSLSFDNIDQRFEYVRHGGKWEILLTNLDQLQELLRNGHSGGIHAVYNLFNATRLCEFKQFADDRGITIKWLSLQGPRALNIHMHGIEIATLAAAEIEKLYANFEVTADERQVFDGALEHYRSRTVDNPMMMQELRTFLKNLETRYHKDQQGKFAELWPELDKVIWQ